MDRRDDTSEDSPKSPPTARVTFAEILQRLDTALAYTDSIGRGEMARKGRFGTYRRQLSKLVDALSRHAGEFPPIVAADLEMHVTEYRAAWSEALELSDTVPYLRTCAPSNVVSKLERVLAGPPLPSDEDHRSSEARNIQFELSFAALLDRAGFRPRLGEHPDVTVNVKGRTFLFECKRIHSKNPEKLAQRISEADGQIRRCIGRAVPTGKGIVALSVSPVFNPEDVAPLIANRDNGMAHLQKWLSAAAAGGGGAEQAAFAKGVTVGVIYHAASDFWNVQTQRFDRGKALLGHSYEPPWALDYRFALDEMVDRLDAVMSV